CLRLIADGGILAEGGVIACETAEEAPPKKKKKVKETDEEIAAKILETVFGGDESLAAKYNVRRTAVYSQSRLTLLEIAE
ncbi:MAG: hypothetical protein IJ386_07910, partial [Clostridia bacterium]|nr:hypothetical protein [Clostridia bacterium]